MSGKYIWQMFILSFWGLYTLVDNQGSRGAVHGNTRNNTILVMAVTLLLRSGALVGIPRITSMLILILYVIFLVCNLS